MQGGIKLIRLQMRNQNFIYVYLRVLRTKMSSVSTNQLMAFTVRMYSYKGGFVWAIFSVVCSFVGDDWFEPSKRAHRRRNETKTSFGMK